MAARFLIYGLLDPESGDLRYVGKSCSGLRRPRRHAVLAKNEDTHKARWIKQLLSRSLVPKVKVLEEFSDAGSLAEAECFWIGHFRSLGVRLTNATDGGDGCVGRVTSVRTKQKIAERLRGRPRSEELRRRLAEVNGARPFSDQYGHVYPTIEQASRVTGARAANIRLVLRGRRPSAAGLQFRYLTSENPGT